MKRILLLFIASFCVLEASAQKVDSTSVKPSTISVDSLAQNLDKLQHNFNVLACEFAQQKIVFELKIFINSVDNHTDGIRLSMKEVGFNQELYDEYLKSYDNTQVLLQMLKISAETTQNNIDTITSHVSFSDAETNLLSAGNEVIQAAFKAAEQALSLFKTTLDYYEKTR